MNEPDPEAISTEIVRLCEARGHDKSICPSEVARALAAAGDDPDAWRKLMAPVRHAAAILARAGRIDILRKGKPIDPDQLRGVVRLRTAAPR